ncbi:MAG: PIN-like domain-containing protein [Chloroflexota bacterium]
MRIFVDEDTGSSIAKALNAVGIPTEYPSASKHSPVKTGDDDCKWLPFAGDKGMLVLSRNIAILQVEAERDLILAHKVGIVFLPAYLTRIDLLRLVMKKWIGCLR